MVSWSMPHLNLLSLPAVDTGQHAGLAWLTTHMSMMFTTRERFECNLHASAAERVRIQLKDSLFCLFMHYSGLQGQRAHVFGITCPTNGGEHIPLFVSRVRLGGDGR